MIEKMHERTNGPAFKIIFALVSLSFVLTGISGSLTSDDRNVVVKVNGDKIEKPAYDKAKSAEQHRRVALEGESFWDNIEKPDYKAAFDQAVMANLINDQLFRQYTQSLKLDVSVDQIKTQIVSDPAFQKDGKFDNTLYQNLLRQNKLTPDGLAQMVRAGILQSQLQTGIFDTQFLTPAEQNVLAKLLFQQRQFSAATLSLAAESQKQSVTEAEAKAYFEAHGNDFIEPEKLKVDYFVISPESVAKTVQISDEDIKAYYDQNSAQFVAPAENHLAHIQLANAEDAKAVEAELKAGKKFEEIAQAKSVDTYSAKQGGDLGWNKAGAFPDAFEKAAATLAVGETSGVVEINGAFHIIKKVGEHKAVAMSLEQAKARIQEDLQRKKSLEKYTDILNEINTKASELSAEELAKLANANLAHTAQFTRDNVPEALNTPKVLAVLDNNDFKASGALSEAIDQSDANSARAIFIRVSDYQAAHPQTFEVARAKVEAEVQREKAAKVIAAQAEDFVAKLAKGETVNLSFSPKQTATYALAEATQPFLAKTLFKMPKPVNGVNYQAHRAENGDMIVFALDNVTDGKAEELKPLLPSLAFSERGALRAQVTNALREHASVEFNENAMEQQE